MGFFDQLLLWMIQSVCEVILESLPQDEHPEEWALCLEYLNMTEPPKTYPLQLEDVSGTSKIILVVLYSLTMMAAVVGNISVLVFSGSRKFRSVNSVFIISLAISDLLLTVFCMPFSVINIIHRTWKFDTFGEFSCKNIPFLQMMSVTATWLTITCISIERYVAVLHPMRSKAFRKRSRAIVTTVVIWIVSALVSVPNLMLYDFITVPYISADPPGGMYSVLGIKDAVVGEETQYATAAASESSDNEELFMNLCIAPSENRAFLTTYRWFNVATLFLPLAWMSYAYGRVIHRLWVRQALLSGNNHVDPSKMILYRRVVKTVAAVMVLFFLCWTPTILYEAIAITVGLEATAASLNLRYYLQWLANSNAFHNPIVYALIHPTIGDTAARCCKRCGCLRARVEPAVVEIPVENLSGGQLGLYQRRLIPRSSGLTPTSGDRVEMISSSFTPTSGMAMQEGRA